MSRPVRPGGPLPTRPLHFIWICDCSSSMGEGGKIQALNNAIREAIPHMQVAADENPNADIRVRAIKFSDGAQWHISQPTPVADFIWTDLSAGGGKDMGKALSMVAEQLKIPPMTDPALRPVLVLISDGEPTDDFSGGLKELMDQPWGKKAVRIAIAIGDDADTECLQKFIGDSEFAPLQANNPEALIAKIRWVSTAVLTSASSPASPTPKSAVGEFMPETDNWGLTIPEEWLKTKTTVAELEESVANPNNRGLGKGFIEEVERCVREGDELWWYDSAEDVWGTSPGESGIAVVRDGKIAGFFVAISSTPTPVTSATTKSTAAEHMTERDDWWGPVIPKEWLKTKTTITELEESAPNWNNPGFWKKFVEQVKACMCEGDELWWYSSPEEGWKALAGEAGIAIVRNGEIVTNFVTLVS